MSNNNQNTAKKSKNSVQVSDLEKLVQVNDCIVYINNTVSRDEDVVLLIRCISEMGIENKFWQNLKTQNIKLYYKLKFLYINSCEVA